MKPLLFVHGREAYRKNSLLILYNFFKNTVYVTTQYFFGFWSAFSGQVLYDPLIYQLYNMSCTAFPIMWFAVFDFEYEKAPEEKEGESKKKGDEHKYLMSNPHLYKIGIRNECFS